MSIWKGVAFKYICEYHISNCCKFKHVRSTVRSFCQVVQGSWHHAVSIDEGIHVYNISCRCVATCMHTCMMTRMYAICNTGTVHLVYTLNHLQLDVACREMHGSHIATYTPIILHELQLRDRLCQTHSYWAHSITYITKSHLAI